MSDSTEKKSVQQAMLERIAISSSGGRTGFPVDEIMQAMKAAVGKDVTYLDVWTCWHDLLRGGLLVQSYPELSHTKVGEYFLTEPGKNAAQNASRDPINSNGYLAYLDHEVKIDAVTRGYVEEALNTYRACCYKATAVMIGAATEKLVLDLRDELVQRMKTTGRTVDKKMESMKVKTAFDKVAEKVLDDLNKNVKSTNDEGLRQLHELADAKLHSIAAEFRKTRNDAGHPASLDPIHPADVHCNLLLFPATAKLIARIKKWVVDYYV